MVDKAAESSPDTSRHEGGEQLWYVWDRNGYLLRLEQTRVAAEAWAQRHSRTAQVGTCIEVAPHDYWYVFIDAANPVGDFQARIIRADNAAETNVYTGQQPRYPHAEDL